MAVRRWSTTTENVQKSNHRNKTPPSGAHCHTGTDLLTMVSRLTDVLLRCSGGLSLGTEVALGTLPGGPGEGGTATVPSRWTRLTCLHRKSALGVWKHTMCTLHRYKSRMVAIIGVIKSSMNFPVRLCLWVRLSGSGC